MRRFFHFRVLDIEKNDLSPSDQGPQQNHDSKATKKKEVEGRVKGNDAGNSKKKNSG